MPQQPTANNMQQIQNIIERDYFLWQSAKEIAFPYRWENLAGNEKSLWGTQVTKHNRYETWIDLRYEKPNFSCTCRSRKKPCRHAVALLILLLNFNDAFAVQDVPNEEMQTWLKRRDQRLQPKNRSEVEEQALAEKRQQNRDKRLLQMQRGLDELEIFLHDTLRNGIATFSAQPPKFWEEWSAKLIAAKMKGIANRFAAFPQLLQLDNWNDIILRELGDIYLIIRGFRQLNNLSEGLQQELFTTIGVNAKKADVLAQKSISDCWKVLAIEEGEEEQLRYRRTWLYGKNCQQFALDLEFVWGNTDFISQWKVGTVWRADCFFYPANFSQRALFQQAELVNEVVDIQGISSFDDLQKSYITALSKNPWLNNFPIFLTDLKFIRDQDTFYWCDTLGKQWKATANSSIILWQLFGLSAGEPIDVFGVYSRRQFLPLAARKGKRWLYLGEVERLQPKERVGWSF